jgi:hypothetical protein
MAHSQEERQEAATLPMAETAERAGDLVRNVTSLPTKAGVSACTVQRINFRAGPCATRIACY